MGDLFALLPGTGIVLAACLCRDSEGSILSAAASRDGQVLGRQYNCRPIIWITCVESGGPNRFCRVIPLRRLHLSTTVENIIEVAVIVHYVAA